MQMMFDTSRLTSGATEVKQVYEMADILGLEVIRVTGKQYSHSIGKTGGFEIGKVGYDARGRQASAVMDRGNVYLYPDKNGLRWGFILDTEQNRLALIAHLSQPILDVADKKIKKELIEYCDENGINTKPTAQANPYIKKSLGELRTEKRADKLESDLRKAQLALKRLEEEKEENEKALLLKQQYAADNSDTTVTEVQYDEAKGEGVEVEVEAVLPVQNKPSPKVKKESKADKPLAGKKIKK